MQGRERAIRSDLPLRGPGGTSPRGRALSTIILHIDMDAFFASVEQRDNPELKGKPVIIGAMPGTRGVVSTCSYEARKFGVHSAMPISEAYKRCPQGIYIRPAMDKYVEVSRRIMATFEDFTPAVEPLSVDEAFLDLTGTEHLWGPPLEAAKKIKGRIKDELHLTGSVGIAPNKFLAKLASDLDKPDGITMAPFDPEEIIRWLAPMPVSKIWGVGIKTRQVLEGMGLFRIADIQKLSAQELVNRFGEHGASMYYLSRGEDDRTVSPHEPEKSVSREHTFNEDTGDRETWRRTLLALARDVGRRVRKKGLFGRTVVFTYRASDFKKHTLRTTLQFPTCYAEDLYKTAIGLMEKAPLDRKKLRLIGVGLTNFKESVQQDLMGQPPPPKGGSHPETAVDAIRNKFGDESIFFAGELE